MDYSIYQPTQADYPRMMEVWEASVRATHLFLAEKDLQIIKPLIFNQVLDALNLYAINHNGKLAGIMGLSDDKIEMLFMHPDVIGKGLGKHLFSYAVTEKGLKKVDVNEHNTRALGFYQHMGFTVTGRTPTDSLGMPYPILEMELV
jgi:putative acetyltransferase